ncbi:MAG: hypothetical protein ACQETO_08845 [Pseudomonadota bacterium]
MMKSHAWDELNDSAKDYFDSAGLIPDSGVAEDVDDKRSQRRRLTELRRRTEERLDWKRAYGDLQFDDLDHFDETDDDRHFGGRYRFEDSADPGNPDED